MMFCSPEEGENTPIFRSQMALCGNFDATLAYMKTNKPMFECYEAFLEACYLNE
jgi:hypothetical protein